MRTIIASVLFCLTFSLSAQCWKSVGSGADFCVAIKEDGTLWAWGNNENGELGLGVPGNKKVPTQVGNESDWESLSTGYGFTVALKTNGTVWVWGRNDFGLGNDPASPTNVPSQVGTDTDWKFVTAGGAHVLAIKHNGSLWGWGRNDFGQLGNGSWSHTNIPTQAGTATNWTTATAGTFHSLAINTTQTLWSWGYNFHGQLGQGTAGFGTELNIPTQIAALAANQWKSIAAGGRHCMAVTETGSLWVWGNNHNFALGLNDGTLYKSIPTRLGSASNWKLAAAGIDHSFATTQDGTLWAWGENTDGQLGDGSFIDRAGPVQIGSGGGWMFADGGLQHSIFLKESDDLFTAGSNNYGQLGIDSLVGHNSPQFVACPAILGIADRSVMPFVVYPNPVEDLLLLLNQQNLRIDKIQIIDGTGKIILQKANAASIDVRELQSGLYWLKISSDSRQYHAKFIKV